MIMAVSNFQNTYGGSPAQMVALVELRRLLTELELLEKMFEDPRYAAVEARLRMDIEETEHDFLSLWQDYQNL